MNKGKIVFDRKRVFASARRFTLVGVPYSIALKEAWRVEKFRVLKRLLATGLVEFHLKEAGSQVQRMIVGTTAPHYIPVDKKEVVRSPEPYVKVYDTQSDQWLRINKSTANVEIIQ